MAELRRYGTSPLMANFADGGKTIVITGAPPPPPQTAVMQPPLPQANVPQPTALPPKAPAGPRFLVLIDPAHGGTEIGSAISPTLPEKDVVLALARKVQHELQSRGIAAGMVRNSDIAITLDQRAISANAARPAIYLALHAANSGKGVHVFTPLVDPANVSSRDFLPWDTAQAAYLELSSAIAGSVSAELETRKLPNASLAAPLRPMNNVAAPAIAVEIASPSGNAEDIASPAYMDQVAQAIAAGIAAMRGRYPRCAREPAHPSDVRRVVADCRRSRFYAYHLRAKVAAEEQRQTQQSQVACLRRVDPPRWSLYVAWDQEGGLRWSSVNVALSRNAASVLALFYVRLGAYLQPGSQHPIGPGPMFATSF